MKDFLTLGPMYNYSDELTPTNELGVGTRGSIGQMMKNIRAINYYGDMIAYGSPTFMNNQKKKTRPLGINYFIPSGMKCSNGEDMYEYVRNIPDGSIFGKRIGKAIKKSLGVGLQGMAPGIAEDIKAGLNPEPVVRGMLGFKSRCHKKTLPVGDSRGKIKSYDGKKWIKDPVKYKKGRAYQTRWIRKEWVSAAEAEKDKAQYEAMKKEQDKEGFANFFNSDYVSKLSSHSDMFFAFFCAMLVVLFYSSK